MVAKHECLACLVAFLLIPALLAQSHALLPQSPGLVDAIQERDHDRIVRQCDPYSNHADDVVPTAAPNRPDVRTSLYLKIGDFVPAPESNTPAPLPMVPSFASRRGGLLDVAPSEQPAGEGLSMSDLDVLALEGGFQPETCSSHSGRGAGNSSSSSSRSVEEETAQEELAVRELCLVLPSLALLAFSN